MTIILPPNSTGTTVATNTVGGADREVVSIGDPSVANTAAVSNANTAGGSSQAIMVRSQALKQQPASPITSTNLGSNGVFTGTWQDTMTDSTLYVQASVFANQASATNGFEIDETDDSANANFTRSLVTATVSASTFSTISAAIRGRYWRVKYTNGSVAQTSFELNATATTEPVLPLNTSGVLQVDGSGVTQPVSGTVTANQGTANVTPWNENVAQFGGNAVVTGTGASGVGIPRVTVANDSTVILGTGSATIGALTANQSVNVAQVAGSATSTAAAGTQLVGIADGAGNKLTTNSTTFTSKFALDVNLLGADGTAFGTAGVVDENVKNIGGNAVSTAASGVQKVGIVGNTAATVDAAPNAAAPTNGLQVLAIGRSTLPTSVTDGNTEQVLTDVAGRVIVRSGGPRERLVTNNLTLTATGSNTLIGAAAASTFRDLTFLQASNTSSTAVRIDISDGTRTYSWFLAASGGGFNINFEPPLAATTAATAWTAAISASVTDVRVSAQAVETK